MLNDADLDATEHIKFLGATQYSYSKSIDVVALIPDKCQLNISISKWLLEPLIVCSFHRFLLPWNEYLMEEIKIISKFHTFNVQLRNVKLAAKLRHCFFSEELSVTSILCLSLCRGLKSILSMPVCFAMRPKTISMLDKKIRKEPLKDHEI